MQLSEHFTLEEFVRSQTAQSAGVDNTPPAHVIRELQRTAVMMEGVRRVLGHPITVTSGYRGPALNTLVHGVLNSAHLTGRACDFVCPEFGSPADVCRALVPHMKELGVDQLILEFDRWTHLAWEPQPRYMAFSLGTDTVFT